MTVRNVPSMGAGAGGYTHGGHAIPVGAKIAFLGQRVFGTPI